MTTLVQKFGGTSVDSLIDGRRDEGQSDLIDIAQAEKERGSRVAVVLSAFSGITDELQKIVNKIRRAFSLKHERSQRGVRSLQGECDRDLDTILANRLRKLPTEVKKIPGLNEACSIAENKLSDNISIAYHVAALPEERRGPFDDMIEKNIWSIGERIAVRAAVLTAQDRGIPANEIDLSDNTFQTEEELRAMLRSRMSNNDHLTFVTGYPGYAPMMKRWGRGYSDATAANLAAALEVSRLEIWKEVPGVLSADPKIVPDAYQLEHLTYREGGELCGRTKMKAIHPQAIDPVARVGIPIHIRHTSDPDATGTIIDGRRDDPIGIVKSVARKTDVPVITVTSMNMVNDDGFAGDIFGIANKHGVKVSSIGDEEGSISIAIEDDEVDVGALIGEIGNLPNIPDGAVSIGKRTLISCVGESSANNPKNMMKIGKALTDADIESCFSTSSEVGTNFTILVRSRDGEKAVQALHAALCAKHKHP